MPIQTTALKNILAQAYTSQIAGQTGGQTGATHAALFVSAPTGGVYPTAGTEPSGGSPAYARKAVSWGSPSNGVITGTCTFDVPSGANVQGSGVFTAATAGTYLDGTQVGAAQSFASQGTYALTITVTVT